MGVIAADPQGRAHGVLEAVPAYLVLGIPDFRAALEEYAPGIALSLEAAEWQQLGHPPLLADAPLASLARLLHAQRQIVPFRGREQLVGRLLAWAEQPGFGTCLVHGPGGQGKTRLAQYVADRLGAGQYTVLWVRPEVPPADLGELAGAARPVLVVVDYAETCGPQALSLIETALRRGGSGSTAFKILLLARTAGDWWTALQSGTHDSRVEDVLDATPVAELEALEPEAGSSRLLAYREAVDSFARNLPRVSGWDHHDWHGVAARLATPNLDEPGFGGALTLHMTALADLLDAAGDADPAASGSPGSPGGKTIEDRLLVHERRYWETTAAAHGLGPLSATLSEALVAALLMGAENQSEADTVLGRLPGLAPRDGTTYDRRAAVREWLCALYPSHSPLTRWPLPRKPSTSVVTWSASFRVCIAPIWPCARAALPMCSMKSAEQKTL
ncbi:hypothetical protein [Streptomyces sp. NPDC059970]|uniref:P-loop NTPase n=1 Tax=Streptomyces sp. NPDC059970 TaxID=3347019 RepID=UPI0036A50E7C